MREKNIFQTVYYVCATVMFICISVFAIIGSIQAKQAGEAIGTYFGGLVESQQEFQQRADASSKIITEILAYFAARGLEEADILSSREANIIADEAVQNIMIQSDRWGKIIQAVNNSFLEYR